MTTDRGAAEAARAIADVLEERGLPYAIGGALALAVAGVPRGTADVDVNVFMPESRIGEVFDGLASLGVTIERESAEARARRDGMFVGRWDSRCAPTSTETTFGAGPST